MSCAGFGGDKGALRVWTFDEHGREELQQNFAPGGEPSPEGGGYPHATKFFYGKDGRLAGHFFDAEGALIQRVDCRQPEARCYR